jgi:hypothetical protein
LAVQAALFAGFLSAFLIEFLSRLEPDPMNIIQDVLIHQTQMMRNSSLGPYVPPDFSPPEYIVVVNALFYASLCVMILAAFIAMLIKSWVREFDRGLRAMSLPEQRAKTREFRYLGMERWRLPETVAVLPLLIQISLLLFSIGLMIFLFHISKPSFGVTMAVFGVGVLYYTMTTFISVFATSSPFHSPLSRTLGTVYRHVHAYFCPSFNVFISPAMDTRPATALGRLRRGIQTFLQKSRPYLERDFEEPITARTMDEVQLSTAASALQRIHDNVPNSHHSEPLQCSVWRVAGSPVLRLPPSFNLPSWILDKGKDEEYFSRQPSAMVVAIVAVSLRACRKWDLKRIVTVRAVLQRMENARTPWAQLVIAVFDCLLDDSFSLPNNIRSIIHMESNDLTNVIRRKDLQGEESLWLLSTLSELCSDGWLWREEPIFIRICLAILSDHAPKWDYKTPPDIVLLEAVVTLAAISCSPDRAYQLTMLTNGHKHPWLLLNLRNPGLMGKLFEDTDSNYHKLLTSFLLLVLYALIRRRSEALAAQYFGIITAKGDLPLCTSALAAIAPAIGNEGLSVIGRMLVAPRPHDPILIMTDRSLFSPLIYERMFGDYDYQLGGNQNPDKNFVAVLLMLSQHEHLVFWAPERLQSLNLNLKNPWLRLTARVVAQLDISNDSGIFLGPFYDQRVYNMIAARSLLRYANGTVTHYTESLLLASFLVSQEFSITSFALEHYLRTILFFSDPPAPSCHLSGAVRAVFSFILPDYQLRIGWTILEIFVDGFDKLPVEWRRTFAAVFFTLSRQPLPRVLQRHPETKIQKAELKRILTWEYFHEHEHEPAFTDSEFSGLDWMAMAWSLHLSQQSSTKVKGSVQGKAQSREVCGPAVNEEFVLRALCKLLDAAPYCYIVRVIPKLYEFVQWFDDTELPEYRRLISIQIREAVRRHQEFQMLHRFHKFHCMWYI